MSRQDNADHSLVSEIEAMLTHATTDTRAAVAALALPGRIRAFSPHYAALAPFDQNRLSVLVDRQLSTKCNVDSVTGISAALALNWCETRDRGYRLERRGDLYVFERTT